MILQTRLSADYIPPPRISQPVAANQPQYHALPQGDGTFSAGLAGQQPQKAVDVQLAQMANDAYNLSSSRPADAQQSIRELEAAGWNRLEPQGDHLVDANGNQVAIDPATLEDASTGFRASIYQNQQGQYVVAYAGTDPSEMPDIGADATQAFGLETKQYNQAIALAKEAEVAFGDGNVVFTGHSLGGGLASAAALATDASGVTFNAAGLSNETLRNLGLNPNAARSEVADSGQLRRYVVNGDPLTLAQQDLPSLPIPFAPPLSPPNAIGHELRVTAPAGTIPVIGAHGGSGDNTVYVEALKQNAPYQPVDLSGTELGLATSTWQNLAEFNFNQLSNGIQVATQIIGEAGNAIKDKAGDIQDVIASDFAKGDYLEGTARITGDVLDGALDVTGDLASGALSLAGNSVQNATDFAGNLVRDAGDYLGLGKPADAVAGFLEGAGNVVSNAADASGKAVDWATDKIGDGAQWLADATGAGAQWLNDRTVEGAQWLGEKTVEGAQWLGEKTIEGAQWAGEKAIQGAQWAGEKTVEGLQWAGDKLADGAVAVKDGVVATGHAIADGASWVGDKVSKAMPWNW